MWNKLSVKQKKILLFGCIFLIAYVAYVFSFAHTFAAIKLNKQLEKQENATKNFDGTLPQMVSKNMYYLAALKSYTIKTEDHESRLWQSISGIAVAQAVNISFNPMVNTVDTNSTSRDIYKPKFNFKGNYFNMVKLLDSLSKTNGIGRISTLKLTSKKENGDTENDALDLTITFSAIVK